MRERGSIVYDFDGTWTDSYGEMEPVLRSLSEYFQTNFRIEPGVFWAIWERMKEGITGDHENFGIRKHPNEEIITAPLSSSIFELYKCILANSLDYFANSEEEYPLFRNRFRNKLRTVVYSCSSSWSGSRVGLEDIATSILNNLMLEAPRQSMTVFRPGLEDNIRFALDSGFDIAVVSNSPREVIEAKIQTRQSLCDLVRRIGHDRIIGSARKDHISPDWDGKDIQLSHGFGFKGVRERVRLTRYGLYRPVYMRRQNFAWEMERLGFTRSFPRIAIGDCLENDLLLPHYLHSEVGLIDHPYLPFHERSFAMHEHGARLITSFEDVSEMLSAAA